jgi:NAD(P)-dependent dehydrogenase (short-subunit alcohol dehydrogenase family)
MFVSDLLKEKRVLVTGGGTGLGKSMSERFLTLGAKVVICGRREQVLKETCEELNAKFNGMVAYKVCDVRDAQSIEKMLDEIWQEEPINVLINNAAGNFISRTEDLSYRAVDIVLNIVLHGTANMTLDCGKRWLKFGTKATVLNIVTTYSWTGSAYVVPSAMAKAGVLAIDRKSVL